VSPYQGPPAGIDQAPPDDVGQTGLVRLALLAVVGGALTGLIAGLFRLVLAWADVTRTDLLLWTRDAPLVRWVVPVVAAAVAVGLARLIVRFAPEASGSGVQRVEAAMRGELPVVARLRILPAKFVGGVLSMGAGLALGREGPSVQMGASIGNAVARVARLDDHDARTLSGSLAGAGLGVAFSAPVGGALFVFEEVAHAFRTRLVVATLVGSGCALAVAQLIVGHRPVFLVGPTEAGSMWLLILFALLGLLLGALGVAYNWLVIAMIDGFSAIRRIPPEAKAAVVGAAVGLLGVWSPSIVGGGEGLNQRVLVAGLPVVTLAGIVAIRWFLGPVSYSLGTPGGLFAPLLLVGAAGGSLLASAVNMAIPAAHLSTVAFAIVGMSTFFTAVVRAPFTGIVLIVEMTATTSLLVPMLIAAGTAQIAATVLKGKPIYETLRERLPDAAPSTRAT
jgi:CIC family chloride channel protein